METIKCIHIPKALSGQISHKIMQYTRRSHTETEIQNFIVK